MTAYFAHGAPCVFANRFVMVCCISARNAQPAVRPSPADHLQATQRKATWKVACAEIAGAVAGARKSGRRQVHKLLLPSCPEARVIAFLTLLDYLEPQSIIRHRPGLPPARYRLGKSHVPAPRALSMLRRTPGTPRKSSNGTHMSPGWLRISNEGLTVEPSATRGRSKL